MRVALLSYDFSEYSIQLANGLAEECDVLLMLPRAESTDQQQQIASSVRLHQFHKPRLRQPFRQFLNSARLIREIRRFRPDVIHLQYGHMWFNLTLLFLRSYPFLVTIHDPSSHVGDRESQRTPQWIIRYGYNRADRTIVHGKELKRQVTELIGIPAEKVHVVPHIAIGSEEIPRENRFDGKTILFFGRIWGYKGLRHLIEAEPLISRAISNARIIIAGTGDDFDSYRRLMANPTHFEVHNRFISNGERDKLFQRASVVVLPYIEATQSGVIPVAYSFAKPVVATRVGALPDAVDHGVTGLLVPPADAAALADAIINILQDPDRAAQMGTAGRMKLDVEWSPRTIAQQTIDVYKRTIHDRRPHDGAVHSGKAALEIQESLV